MTQLSVSSAILAAVLSGCSQQQVIGTGSSQQQLEGGSQVASSQQQVEAAAPVVVPRAIQPRPVVAPRRMVQPKRRIVRRAPPRPKHVIKRSGSGLPNAKPGQCFAKVKVPATFKTQSRRILIQKASSKRVLVRAPQYRWVSKKVLVRKAIYKTRVQPAQYRTTTQRVMVKPAYNTWRKGHGAITRIDNMTGQIMCRVTVPAVYKNIQKRVLVRPARAIRTLVPAVYKTVKQKQRVASALYKTVHTPARFKTQNYRVKVGGARYVWRSILCQTNAPKNYHRPAVKRKAVVRSAHRKQYKKTTSNHGISYETYLKVMRAGAKPTKNKTRKVKRSSVKKMTIHKVMKKPVKKIVIAQPKKVDKKVVLKQKTDSKVSVKKTSANKSKAETKKGIVFNIQTALNNKGFDPGTIDGKMGPGTAAALKAFQKSRGLPVGQLTKDTFRALGLIR